MSDIEPIASYLTKILTDGAPALGLALFLSALGYPLLPGTLFVIAAGAFVRQGIIHWADSSFLILLGAVLGDSAGYFFGYFVTYLAGPLFEHSARWQKVRETFARRGGLVIYLTRFLLTPLAIPVNLIAAGSGYTFGRFLLYDVAGQLTRSAVLFLCEVSTCGLKRCPLSPKVRHDCIS